MASEKSFTSKQRIFISEYLIHKNATKSAINAGYSRKTAKSAGSRLLTNVDISSAISKSIAEQIGKAGVTAHDLIVELKKIAFDEFPDHRKASAKVRALELLGKAIGIFNDQEKQVAEVILNLSYPDHRHK